MVSIRHTISCRIASFTLGESDVVAGQNGDGSHHEDEQEDGHSPPIEAEDLLEEAAVNGEGVSGIRNYIFVILNH